MELHGKDVLVGEKHNPVCSSSRMESIYPASQGTQLCQIKVGGLSQMSFSVCACVCVCIGVHV